MEKETFVKLFDEPKWNRKEILRYARVKEATAEVKALLEECIAEVAPRLCYKVVYREYPMSVDRWTVSLGFGKYESEFLTHGLGACGRVVVFVATVGHEIDWLVSRYAVLSPAKAHMIDAIGSERVESLCDAFCAEVAKREGKAGHRLHPRISPGYGDIPLSMQRDIFAVLECQKRVGVTLGERLLMTPRKSVSALIGIF